VFSERSIMERQENRVKSFDRLKVNFINKDSLARDGFYYIGPHDQVKCYFCNVEVKIFNEGGTIFHKHNIWYPFCSSKKYIESLTKSRDLSYEANRLDTFKKWPKSFIDKHQLALLGFYYIGPEDHVKCYFCNVELAMWEEGDDILADHIKWSPFCNFIQRNVTNNIPIDEETLNRTLPLKAPTRNTVVSEGVIGDLRKEDDFDHYHCQTVYLND